MSKRLVKEKHAAAIYDEDGKVTGVVPMCPHCKRAFNHAGDAGGSWNITTVGNIRVMECGKCRKRFQTLTLAVPLGVKAEHFYEQIRDGLESTAKANFYERFIAAIAEQCEDAVACENCAGVYSESWLDGKCPYCQVEHEHIISVAFAKGA